LTKVLNNCLETKENKGLHFQNLSTATKTILDGNRIHDMFI
jgi:hypothetical protein